MKRGGRKRSSEGENVSSQERGGPRSRARLRRRRRGGGPAASNSEAAGGLHAPIFDEVLEHNGEDQIVRSQDEVTPFYLGSQEEQVVGTQGGSMERTGGSASRIKELEELLAKVTEEKKQVVATLNEYKVANKNLEDKLAKEELTSLAALREYKRVELEVQELRAEKELLSTTTQELVLKSSSDRVSGSRTKDKVLETVEPQYMGLAMKLVREISSWAVAEVSELRHDCESRRREWRGRGEQACELFAVKNGDVGIVPLPPSFVAKSGRYFLPSFSSEQEAMESIVKAETEKEPWQGMFSTEDSRREVIGKMINNRTLRSRLKQSLSDTCSVRKRSARDALFELLNYKTLLSRSTASSAEAIERKGKEIKVAQQRLLQKRRGSEELDLSWWRTCGDTMWLRMQEDGSVDNTTVLSGVSEHWQFQQAFDMEDSAEVEKLELFRTEFCRQVLHQFLGFDPTGGDGQSACAVEGSVVWLARLDAWVATVVQCLAERETRGGHRQKLYADTYGAMLRLAMEQLTGNIRAFVKYWEPDELVAGTAGEATKLIQVPSSGQKYLSVESRWFGKYISTELGEIHDCYIAKIEEDSTVSLLGTPTIELGYD